MRVLHRFVKRAAKLLASGTSSAHVQRSFDDLLDEIRQAILRHPGSLREAALTRMRNTSELFGSRLFCCYDHPDLERTNNGLEGLFRITRRHERLITGHKSTARRTVREGEFLVPALQRHTTQAPTAEDLAQVPEEVWRSRLKQIRLGRAHYDRPRKIRNNLEDVLRTLVKRCRFAPLPRSP